jgi:Secretion system C-terminal sorting domain
MKKLLYLIVLGWSLNGNSQTCPELLTVLINSCPAGETAANEWFTFKTGTNPLPVNNFTFQYGTPPTFSTMSLNAGTVAFVTQPGTVTLSGCASINVILSGATIPANSNVFVIPSTTTLTTINLSGVCNSGVVYVLFYNPATATGYASGGNFANAPAAARGFRLTNTAAPCSGTFTPSSGYTYTNSWGNGNDGNGVNFRPPNSASAPSYENAGCTGGTVLPVSLISFTAGYKNNIANLKWETSAEENASHFEIEKSFNGKDFISTGRVYSTGNSNTNRRYQFDEQVSTNNTIYYRLKMVDKNGLYTYSTVIKLHIGQSGFGINSLYPIPAKNELTVNWNAHSANEIQMIISDLTGRNLQTQMLKPVTGNNLTKLNIQQLPPGTYFLVIQTNEERLVEKFVKQ